MARGPLYQSDYRPLFSGHETFPLRYSWLKKTYDAVSTAKDEPNNKAIFLGDDAIARFGVGKNMVGSMRHWASSCGVIAEESSSGQLTTTQLGDFLFGSKGVDPYLEHPASLWLFHWQLCAGKISRGLKTTWYWAFNHYAGSIFKRDDFVDGLMKFSEARGWQRISRMTIQRDVECFVRTYETKPIGNKGGVEESLESALAELGLVRGIKGHFQLVRVPKRSLPNEVFAYALNSFWNQYGSTRTLSFEAVAYEPGSPGRIFLLNETELAERLLAMETVTGGAIRWSETAGLKQILRERTLSEDEALQVVSRAYVVDTNGKGD
jgi:hypothetical protein